MSIKKYLIVGDLHDKIGIVNKVLNVSLNDYTKIFVGDYVDSFNNTVEDQIKIVTTLLDAVENRDDVVALIGNHELSYIKSGMMCSGYNGATAAHMTHLESEIWNKFRTHFYITDDLLATHAGANGDLFESKEEVLECLTDNDPCLYDIGRSRGGSAAYGGTFWCDYWDEFEPIEGLTQIVGHSSRRPLGKYDGVVYEKGCYNIDCLDRINEVLTVEVNGDDITYEVINLDDYEISPIDLADEQRGSDEELTALGEKVEYK